jgi:hypothetical protein
MNRFVARSLFSSVLVLSGCAPAAEEPDPLRTLFSRADLHLSSRLLESAEMKRFLETHGAPARVELVKELDKPPVVKLFYEARPEIWNVREIDGTWQILGPYPLEAPAGPEEAAVRELATGVSEQLRAPETPYAATEKFRAIVAQEGKEDVERTARGDVVHVVTSSEETLEVLAAWYAFDPTHAAKIARMNGILPKGSVDRGARIIIPRYLTHHTKRLTSAGARAIAPLLQGAP